MMLELTIKDALTLIVVPIVAVLVTLVVQDLQQKRDRRYAILRALLSTRHLPADFNYSAAINLIPVEFNRVRSVMDAWRAYIEAVRFRPQTGNEAAHDQLLSNKQTKLIAAIMTTLKMKYSESDILADAYAAGAFISRDTLYIESLKAACASATALDRIASSLMDASSAAPPVALRPVSESQRTNGARKKAGGGEGR